MSGGGFNLLDIFFLGLALLEISAQKIVEFSLFAVSADFFKILSLKLIAVWWCSYKVPKTIFIYIEFI